jgi:predicted RNA binding protein YcfA (HicA-like mRNA interferase family)
MRHRDVIRKIEANGGQFVRQVGSHRRYKATYQTVDASGQHKIATAHTTVPVHGSKDIPTGTLHKIQDQMEAAFGRGWLL